MDPEELTVFSNNQNLKRLNYWLKYQISSSFLLILSWMFPLALLLTTIVALIFAPFMLFILYKEKKFGWIIFFGILIIFPLIIIIVFSMHSTYFMALILIPLALFYFYCFILRLTVSDWLS
jgi:hypothetical protein